MPLSILNMGDSAHTTEIITSSAEIYLLLDVAGLILPIGSNMWCLVTQKFSEHAALNEYP